MLNYSGLGQYLSYKQLTNNKEEFNQNTIIEYIKINNAKELLIGLTALLRVSFDEQEKIKPDFIFFLKSLNKNFNYSLLMNSTLASKQSIMITIKWVIVHGNFKNVIINSSRNNKTLISQCILLTSMIADSLESHVNRSIDYDDFLEKIAPEMQRNAYFNSIDNIQIFPAVVRNIFYFMSITNSDKLKNEPDYTNCAADFAKYYDYSIEQYIGSILTFEAVANKSFSLYNNFYDIYINKITDGPFKHEIILRVINHLTIDINDAKTLLAKTYKEDWGLDLFWQYGFLKTAPNEIIPLNLSAIVHNISLSLKFEIQKIYPNNSLKRSHFLSFYGKIQEAYIIHILEKTTINLSYVTVTPEFNYRGNKSPDAMVSLGKRTLLVFESKGYSLKKHSLFSIDDSSYIQDEEKLAVDPIKQTIDRLDELKDFTNTTSSAPIIIEQFNKIYIFSLTAEGTPFNSYGQEVIDKSIQDAIISSKLNDKIKGYYHLSIEHFELFLSWLFISKSKKNITTKLDEFFSSKESLNNFLYRENIDVPRIPFLQEREYIISNTINSIIEEGHYIE